MILGKMEEAKKHTTNTLQHPRKPLHSPLTCKYQPPILPSRARTQFPSLEKSLNGFQIALVEVVFEDRDEERVVAVCGKKFGVGVVGVRFGF